MDPLVTLTATSLSKDLTRSELREIIFNDRAQMHNNLAQMANILEKNRKLEEECKKLKEDNSTLLKVIKNNEETIDFLKRENESLKLKISELENKLKDVVDEVKKLKNEKLRMEAIMKLHECDMIANKAFKKAYRKHFKLEFSAPAPDLGDFVNEPISREESPGSYVFWENFKEKHPGSDNLQFQEIYSSLNISRAPFAHPKVARLSKDEFDALAKVAFDDYETRKNVYGSYRDWLYSFPA